MLLKRPHRVGDLIREILCEMLLKNLSDPRLEAVTITEVEVTNDLKMATVFFSVRGNPPQEEASLRGLQSATGYIKKRLGKELRIRYIPDLVFKVDHSLEYGSRIDRLIETIKEEKGRGSGEDR